MATIRRSIIKTSKTTGETFRVYAVLVDGWEDSRRIRENMKSGGFAPYLRREAHCRTQRTDYGASVTIWVLPARPLLDSLFYALYRAVADHIASNPDKGAKTPKLYSKGQRRADFIDRLKIIEERTKERAYRRSDWKATRRKRANNSK